MNKQFPPKQQLAAELLGKGTPVREVAYQVEVSLSQLYKWRTIPAFKAYVLQLTQQHESASYQEILSLKPTAVTMLKAMLNSKDSRTALKACELIMKFGT